MIDVSRYEFQTLGDDGEFTLYRGTSQKSESAILMLSTTVDPSPESLRRLQNEHSLRNELDSAWASRPMRIAAHGDRTVLMLHDPGGVPLDHLLTAF